MERTLQREREGDWRRADFESDNGHPMSLNECHARFATQLDGTPSNISADGRHDGSCKSARCMRVNGRRQVFTDPTLVVICRSYTLQ